MKKFALPDWLGDTVWYAILIFLAAVSIGLLFLSAVIGAALGGDAGVFTAVVLTLFGILIFWGEISGWSQGILNE